MNAPQQAKPEDPTLGQRLRAEVERTIQRNLKGFEYLGSPAPAVGMTPKTLLHRRGTLSLYHYRRRRSDEVYRVPILFVMATTNKAYIFDLAPGQSLIEFLLKRGYDVYVMDWNPPTRRRELSEARGLHARLHPRLRPPRAEGFGRRATSRSSATAWAACCRRSTRRCMPTAR